ncbi:MAG: hypothetical protein ACD_61C00235G0003 [uncultured bacterium]|nr:MAG: hypothetical protein ACD_61C00235G0003 [uncultured bacterium]
MFDDGLPGRKEKIEFFFGDLSFQASPDRITVGVGLRFEKFVNGSGFDDRRVGTQLIDDKSDQLIRSGGIGGTMEGTVCFGLDDFLNGL